MTLRIQAHDNYGQFDEIQITQVEKLAGDLCVYRIEKPKGNWPLLNHYRSHGWLRLMKKALFVLVKGDVSPLEFQADFEGDWDAT